MIIPISVHDSYQVLARHWFFLLPSIGVLVLTVVGGIWRKWPWWIVLGAGILELIVLPLIPMALYFLSFLIEGD